jgi:hypothetical protein
LEINLISINTKIVGLKHRAVESEFVRNLVGKKILLQPEPENSHDKYALKAISNNRHFGYIEKDKSKYITKLLDNEPLNVTVLSYDEYKVVIQIDFDLNDEVENFKQLPKGNSAGIYCIEFKIADINYCYIGQSNNINRRLQEHFRALSLLKHHNQRMQSAWDSNKTSFSARILQLAPTNLSSFQLQAWLFEKEILFIEKNSNSTVNAIDGDLVFTKTAVVEFDKLIKLTLKKIRAQRRIYIEGKNLIGQEIIDKGIIKEGVFGRLNPTVIKASNILTWLNKTRYGFLDYRPLIDTNHIFYKPLLQKIRGEQEKVAAIDLDKWFLNQFITAEIKNKEKYQTCELKSLNRVREIFEKYIDKDMLENLDVKSKPPTPDLTSNNTVDLALINKSKKRHYHYGPKEQKEWEKNYTVNGNKVSPNVVKKTKNSNQTGSKATKSETHITSSRPASIVQSFSNEGYSNQDWQNLKSALATLKKPLKIPLNKAKNKSLNVKVNNKLANKIVSREQTKIIENPIEIASEKEIRSAKRSYSKLMEQRDIESKRKKKHLEIFLTQEKQKKGQKSSI